MRKQKLSNWDKVVRNLLKKQWRDSCEEPTLLHKLENGDWVSDDVIIWAVTKNEGPRLFIGCYMKVRKTRETGWDIYGLCKDDELYSVFNWMRAPVLHHNMLFHKQCGY